MQGYLIQFVYFIQLLSCNLYTWRYSNTLSARTKWCNVLNYATAMNTYESLNIFHVYRDCEMLHCSPVRTAVIFY